MAPSVQRRKVWLTPSTRVPCSRAAKTRNPLKFAGVPQTRQQISAVSRLKFTVPSLLYGCEIWSLNSCDYHKMNVIWNNAFRRIFQCCWRESASCLLYYYTVLPVSYVIDQRKLLFIKKIRECDNSVIRSFSAMCTHEYGKILSVKIFHS